MCRFFSASDFPLSRFFSQHVSFFVCKWIIKCATSHDSLALKIHNNRTFNASINCTSTFSQHIRAWHKCYTLISFYSLSLPSNYKIPFWKLKTIHKHLHLHSQPHTNGWLKPNIRILSLWKDCFVYNSPVWFKRNGNIWMFVVIHFCEIVCK